MERHAGPILFDFSTAGTVIFGAGTASRIPALAAEMGSSVLLITGSRPERADQLRASLKKRSIIITDFSVCAEPSTETITQGYDLARRAGCSAVISMGGGSVLDAGKAVAAMMTNKGEVTDYLEVVGKGMIPAIHPAPFIAVPTTAGTGTEVTRNAVITSIHHKVKVSMRGPYLLPRFAVVDPELTLSMPPSITASTGLDALTQLIEAFVSIAASPITDAICREGLHHAAVSLLCAYTDGGNLQAREGMALASLFSGMALANAKLGAVHGFAGPLGGMFPAPHGVICACLLPHVMKANIEALDLRHENSRTMEKFREIARILIGEPEAGPHDLVEWIDRICKTMKIPSLRSMGVTETHIPSIAAQSKKSSSMKGNPVELSDDVLEKILYGALD